MSTLCLCGHGRDAGTKERPDREVGARAALIALAADIAAQSLVSQDPADKERLLGWANALLVHAWALR